MTNNGAEEKASGVVRVVTAIIAAPVFLYLTYLGGFYLLGLVAILAIVSSLEVGSMFESADARPFTPVAVILTILVVGRLWIPAWPIALGAVSLALLAAMPFMPGQNVPGRTAATFFVAIYPAWLFSFLISLREGVGIDLLDNDLTRITILVILLVWASDTFAYYTGRAIGKTPFFPKISPKKTWEGFAGGLVGTIAVAFIGKTTGLVPISNIDAVALAVICGVVTPIGDLVESKLKRSFGVKDAGSILPGHGGVLDRFDGMVLAVPVVWGWLVVGGW